METFLCGSTGSGGQGREVAEEGEEKQEAQTPVPSLCASRSWADDTHSAEEWALGDSKGDDAPQSQLALHAEAGCGGTASGSARVHGDFTRPDLQELQVELSPEQQERALHFAYKHWQYGVQQHWKPCGPAPHPRR